MFGKYRNCWFSSKTTLQRTISNADHRKSLVTNSKPKDLYGQNYCLDLVEKNDYENFLCTLLLNGAKRRHAFAVRALNVEIAKIGSSVSEEHIATMKLKFWLDSIDKCFDKDNKSVVSAHPVLYEIKYMTDNFKLTKAYFKRLITARQRSPNEQFITSKDMENYAEQTVSPIYYLLLETCGVKDINVDHAASHLGKAQGITNLLRAIPFKRRSEAINIPQEVLIKNGVSQERVIRGANDDKGVQECIFEVATLAYQHLERARNLCKRVPRDITALFLPSVAVDRYLDRLRRADFRLTDKSVLQRDSMLALALYWMNLRSKY